jgi:tetratricopeptide (TPR) repeat protein
MNDLFFWLQWKSSYKALYVALLILFFASIVAVGISYVYGDVYAIGWNTTGEWKTLSLSLDTFKVNQFEIPQESEQFLLLKRYVPNDIHIHTWVSYMFLASVTIGFLIILTAISYLDLWLYIIGMLLFLVFVVTMNTELLGILNQYNRLPVALILALFGGLTYYFNAFGESIGFFQRLLFLFSAVAVVGCFIQFGSAVEYPLLYVSNYALIIPIIISIIFMFVVGYDILHFAVVITSYGKSTFKTQGNSIWNFIIIGTLYLTNLFLVYYKPDFIQELNIVLLQPFAILAISGIIGIWLFEIKEEVTRAIPFKPLGALLYLSFGMITFTTIAYGYATANDALITTLEKTALYIQIGLGLGIFIYVLTNFWTRYKKQEQVYKQFYITYQVPFFVARSFGWAIVMYFIFSTNRYVYRSAKAAYYNNIGDVYLFTEQDALAESYYKEAWSYDFPNQRSNFSLSTFYKNRDNKANAFQYFESSLTRNTTPYAFANISEFYLNNNQLFPALFMLQDGLKKYPNNPYLLNNLGYLYTKFDTSDSAVYFFNKAATYTEDDIPASNLLAYFGAQGKFKECATILAKENKEASDTYLSNKIAVATLEGKSESSGTLPTHILTDSIVSTETFTYLYNYTFNKLSLKDTLLDATLERLSNNEENKFYRGDLLYAKALHIYFSHINVGESLQVLQTIIEETNKPLYVITLANLQLKMGLYEQAYKTYRLLISHPDQRLFAYKCLAASASGNVAEVTALLDVLKSSLIPEVAEIAKVVQASVNPSSKGSIATFSDQEKVQYLHYQSLTNVAFENYKKEIQDTVQRILFEIDRISTLNKQNQYTEAMNVWNTMKKPNDIPEEILAIANLEKLKLLNGLEQWNVLETELKSTVLRTQDMGYIDYFTARRLENSKDSMLAKPYYEKAIHTIGYDPYVQIDYANYISKTVGELEGAEKLVDAKKYITYSIPLSIAYIDAFVKLGLFKSAEVELNEIQSKLSTAEIADLKSKFYVTPTY